VRALRNRKISTGVRIASVGAVLLCGNTTVHPGPDLALSECEFSKRKGGTQMPNTNQQGNRGSQQSGRTSQQNQQSNTGRSSTTSTGSDQNRQSGGSSSNRSGMGSTNK
jgi:hypothetical protein